MEIGEKIKNRRVLLNLTQEELAERAELTKGFISQVERDLTSPSVDSLFVILEALGTNMSEFFKEEVEEQIVFSKDDYIENIDDENLSLIKWVVPNAQKNNMEPIILEIEPKGKSKTYSPNEGEEFGYVLEGQIKLLLNNKEYIVKEGECFYTKADKTRVIVNDNKKKAKLIWITNPPNF
ncbi:cupin domain-containing protein [Miniphocaeibacter halophilus]|uniref:Cupin domain-containing protein n=1 Tax=Miniphocaeibacter halophilus TaxID=2931922 RepID=A0AC61MPS1_9FIRM|nr:cupin domain-containing protein [Miniphocaeibacter halophilus]QQK07442.1 cupin domain-containing protein [Miniphocaeibacter halophilus]